MEARLPADLAARGREVTGRALVRPGAALDRGSVAAEPRHQRPFDGFDGISGPSRKPWKPREDLGRSSVSAGYASYAKGLPMVVKDQPIAIRKSVNMHDSLKYYRM
jgi:hypothetical protein